MEYKAGPTASRMHRDDTFVRMMLGPFGSGKSVACINEILMRTANDMPPGPDGVRRARWAAIRNSYRELTDTTLKTVEDWIPESIRTWTASDMRMDVIWEADIDGEDEPREMHLEILFRALDRPDDIKKLLSLELTGAFVNESREVPKAVFDAIQGRVGRYPRRGGGGWFGVIADSNPPDSDHWIYRVFEEERPDEYRIFKQPSGLSDEAENLENLPEKYYERMCSGKEQSWIDVYVHGKYGYVQDGKPVFPEFHEHNNVALEELKGDPRLPLIVGLDFGLTPAAVFAQQSASGQWRFIDELVTEDMGAKQFGKLLSRRLQDKYPGYTVEIYGDPAGDNRAQTDERTPFQVLSAVGVIASPAPSQDPVVRRDALADHMLRVTMAGEPGLLVSPLCKMLRKGLSGAYKYKRMQVAGEERYQDKPLKNLYSHVCEAAEYLMVGAGEGYKLLGGGDSKYSDWSVPVNG
jgi:hypothetical protein